MKFMTDTQCAYIAGRNSALPLGGVDCHVYFEFDCDDIDTEKLSAAWKELFRLHPEMRAEYRNGTVIDREKLPDCSKMNIVDISNHDRDRHESILTEMRSSLSSRMLDTEQGESCGLTYVHTDNKSGVLLFDWSLVIGDVKSFILVLSELADLYDGEKVQTPKTGTGELYELRKEAAAVSRGVAAEIIKNDIHNPDYPIGAALPVLASANMLSCCRYCSEDRFISGADLLLNNEDIDALLMYAFTDAFCELTGDSGLLLNYPCFRRSVEESGNVGDFTDIKLIPILYDGSVRREEGIYKACKTYQKYMSFSGYKQVKLRREIAKVFPDKKDVSPIVFSPVCDIPLLSKSFLSNIGRLRYMISQTPQVWLDVQTFVLEKKFYISIVYPQELIAASFVSALADGYAKKIRKLINKGV